MGLTNRVGVLSQGGRGDPAEAVALVAHSRRELLLRAHRHRLGREDLEDCFSQATLEILTRARARGGFATRSHIANALEQRFLSRIFDRRRQIGGRSPIEAALAHALPLFAGEAPEVNPADERENVERTVVLRDELRRIAELSRKLSRDQRLLLAHRLSSEESCTDFCQTHGWSVEKYRKVCQRTRARLRRLLEEESRAVSVEPFPRCVRPTMRVLVACEKKLDSPVPLASQGRSREQGHIYDIQSPPT